MRSLLLRWAMSRLVLGMAAVSGPQARAQTYPSKPIHFIVPFPAGGATDAAARAIQPLLEKIPRPDRGDRKPRRAGAVIGLDSVAKSAPDGYTFGIGPAGAMSVNPAMEVKMPFDVRKDLAAISNLAETLFILAAPSSPRPIRFAT